VTVLVLLLLKFISCFGRPNDK